MGIRYYAYPVGQTDIESARQDPWPFLSDDPLLDAWSAEEDRPLMLYLDMCWPLLQDLLGPGEEGCGRESFALVEGNVVFTYQGWIPHIQVLEPSQVAAIARDLMQVDQSDVNALFEQHLGAFDPDDLEYVMQYLGAAKKFVGMMTDSGQGLVYLIG